MATAGSISIKTGFQIDTASYNRVENHIKKISKSTTSISDGFKKMGSVAKGLGAAVTAAFSIKAITAFTNECKKLYEVQMTAETKLETVVRQRMGLRNQEIQQIKDFASAIQGIGVVGDEVQLMGAAQLATFLSQKEALTTLMPALANLLVAQKGLNGTATDAYNIANMMGKVMQGQTAALRRIGITFTEAEEKVLQYGNELERASMLAKIISNNVGEMNKAMAQTPLGRQQQLKNTIGDITEKFGQAAVNIGTIFLPVLQKVAVWLDLVASAAIKVSTAIARVFGGSELKQSAAPLSSIASDTESAVDGLEDLGGAYEEAGKAASKASRGVLSFDNVIQINKGSDSGSSSDSSASAGISSMASSLESEEVDGEINSIAEKIKNTIDKIKVYFSENIEMPKFDFNEDLITLDFINIINNLKEIARTTGTLVLNVTFKFWNDSDGVGIIEQAMILLYKLSETLVPIIETVRGVLTSFYQTAIQPIVQWVGEKLKDAMAFLGEQLEKVGAWFVENKENLIALAEGIGKVIGLVWNLFTLVADPVWDAAKVLIGLVVDALLWLADLIAENYQIILAILQPLILFVGTGGILALIGKGIFLICEGIVAVKGFIAAAIGVVKALFALVAANPVIAVVVAIVAIITYLWNTNEDFRNFVIGMWEKIKEVMKGIIDFLKNGFQNGFEGSLGFVGGLIDTWVGHIKAVFANIKQIFGGLIDFITGVFTGDWDKAFGGLKNIVLGVVKTMLMSLKLPFDVIAKCWNSIVDKIGTLTVPEWVPLIGGNSFNLPRITIPEIKLAHGGVVTGRTWAEIGEQGPEVVMPLRNNSFTEAFAADLVKAQAKYNSTPSSNAVNINIYADKVIGNDWSQIAKEVKKALEKESIRVGGVSYAY